MQIDWFTFVAQVLNFLILVLLLRRFLYRPVLRVIEEREEGIRSRVREAEEDREGARRAAAAAREREAEIESERKERLRAVETDVAAIRRELLEEAREEA
ncbi:MAG: F0F1 ATP synthase subunit B, partial [Gemmatimonadota bacterium]